MSGEFRVFGPPGTGKTTYLARQIKRAANHYPHDEIFACSFTRAAAHELVGRDLGLAKRNVGTIHSLCWHALNCPPIVEVTSELREEWNSTYPHYAVESDAVLDERPVKCDALREWNRLRSMLSNRRGPEPFATLWEEFKRERMAVDFTDLLLQAPGSLQARILFVDEAQDLTPLQWRVVRHWGAEAETFVVAGDDDQVLYQFLGADPAAFLAELPIDRKRVLGESHRLPRAVWEAAEAWVDKLAGRREPKHYRPRDEAGLVTRRDLSLGKPAALVAEMADRAADGQTCMALASCSYMLSPLIRELKGRGIPYHNPFRGERGDWNPLRRTAKRLLDYLHAGQDDGSRQDARAWWSWIEMVRSENVLQRGAKVELERLAREYPHELISEVHMLRWLTPPVIAAALAGDIGWLRENMTARFRTATEYPAAILRVRGERGLTEPPGVIVGTIHSVKGGEADIVYLFPDLSLEAWRQLQLEPQAERDALVRQFYVGMTRARRELHLCAPTGGNQYVRMGGLGHG